MKAPILFPSSHIKIYERIADSHGVDFISEAGIPAGEYQRIIEGKTEISAETKLKMIQFVARLTPKGMPPSIYLTKHFTLDQLGLAGMLVAYSRDLEEALRYFIKYQKQVIPVTRFTTEFRRETTRIDVETQTPIDALNRFYNELSLTGMSLVREYIGSALLVPDYVEFSHTTPYDLSCYEELFKCPVKFGSERTGLTVSNKTLRVPLASANIFHFRTLEEKLAEDDQDQTGFTEKLSLLIRDGFLSGIPVTRKAAAAALNVSERTLIRKLQRENTDYRTIFNQQREFRAKYLLERTPLPNQEIARQLGYSSPAAFTRSFKGLSGVTPTEYRKQGHQSGN